jgi:hypothetical protein
MLARVCREERSRMGAAQYETASDVNSHRRRCGDCVLTKGFGGQLTVELEKQKNIQQQGFANGHPLNY